MRQLIISSWKKAVREDVQSFVLKSSHDVEKIEEVAFENCPSLRRVIILKGEHFIG